MTAKKKDVTPFALKAIRVIFPVLERIAPALAHRYFVTIFFSPLRYGLPDKEKHFIRSATKFSLQVSGKHVQGYRWGKGPIVLVVHGWAGRATQFRKFVSALTEKGYEVVGFDGPAHGLSGGKKTNLLEFDQVLKWIFDNIGHPVAAIAHSFGGVAVLFSIANGLSLTKLINIASPTIGDEVIKTYLRAINGSDATGEAFKKYILRTYGRPFDEFSSLYLLKNLAAPLELLAVHDKDDPEVIIRHVEELVKVYPQTRLFLTSGLGHTRILKDERVIEKCITFISSSG